MKHHRLLTQFQSQPWALHPAALAKFSHVLTRWSAGIPPTPELLAEIEQDKVARAARRDAAARAGGGVIAVLPLYGIITQRGNMMDDISGPGSCSTQAFCEAFRAALADPSVSAVLIDIDSPGGSVYGVQELAAEILGARGQKPVVGIANSLAASAAYWIGSACSELYCTPSGEVGSIGVYTAHADMSKAYEEAGYKMTLISAGKYKTEGNPFEPLGEEALAAIQASVDGYYAAFSKAVAKGRGVGIDAVRSGMGEGRCLSADAALAENMIDGIKTFDQVVKDLQKQMKTTRGAGALALDADDTTTPAPQHDRIALARKQLEILG